MGNTIKILHLSDLHISEKYWNFSGENDGDVSKPKLIETREALVKFLKNQKINFIAITGDIVNNGSEKTSWKKAFKFIDILVKSVKINKRNVFIVPGNHDLNRDPLLLKERYNFFIKYYNTFYANKKGDKNIDKISFQDPMLVFRKEKWVYSFPKEKVNFIPLYSPLVNPEDRVDPNLKKIITLNPSEFLINDHWKNYLSDKLINKKQYALISKSCKKIENIIKKTILNKSDIHKKWFKYFDRGFIAKDQLEKIDKPLAESQINICLFHHHPLPIVRYSASSDYNIFPETNILSNGIEVIKALADKNINIILHGHRHQKNYYQFSDKKFVVIGAPSFIVRNNEVKTSDDSNFNGFNIIEINNLKLQLEINIKEVELIFQPGPKFRFRKDQTSLITIERYETPKILSYQLGLKELGNQILESMAGETILHYKPDAQWRTKKKGKYFTPFTEFIHEIVKKGDVLYDLADIVAIEYEDIKIISDKLIEFNKKIKLTKYSDKKQIETIHAFFNYFMKKITPLIKNSIYELLKKNNRSFIKFLKRENEKSDEFRQYLYSLEIFKCLINVDWHVHKAIYFLSDAANVLTHHDMNETNEGKYRWLLESLLELSFLKNYQLSWLPFRFKNYKLKSIVAFNGNNNNAIMIGFEEEDNQNHPVLKLKPIYKNKNDENIYEDLKALLSKNIYPVTNLLIENFPILINGTIHLETLYIIAKVYNINIDIFNRFCNKIKSLNKERETDYFNTDSFNPSLINNNKIKESIEKIYNMNTSKLMSTNKNKVLNENRLHWDEEDYLYVKKNLKADFK